MDVTLSRRQFLQTSAAATAVVAANVAAPGQAEAGKPAGVVHGQMSGATAIAEVLRAEGVRCVYGIPGAQENELWDAFKQRGVPYLLSTHEFSAAGMADGYARATGEPGVLCVVPGPGLTNSLSGLGEALLDSVPIVCLVGDVANGRKYRPFQVHSLPTVDLVRPVVKEVISVDCAEQIPCAVRRAFQVARAGEPGPTAVVVPYNLLIEKRKFDSAPLAPAALPWDEAAFQCALRLLCDRGIRVGLYLGMGTMDFGPRYAEIAEVLQAPIATSVSGKGAVCERHPLSVGWGYGPQATSTAEAVFRREVDLVLAVGVRFSEVSTGFYAIPKHRHLIHVDANPENLGVVTPASVCVNADAGLFAERLLAHRDSIERPKDAELVGRIGRLKAIAVERHRKSYGGCAVDPMALVLELRCALADDAMLFVDVTASEHWAAEAYEVRAARTYFNPTDNQSMGWSIPASLGAQRAFPCRQAATITGDGCFLMSAMELATAAREGLPVKFFVLDDRAYHYMQALQLAAYSRTTATVLGRLDYSAFATALGVGYNEIRCEAELAAGIRGSLAQPGPVLTRVLVDYGKRPIRWLEAVRGRFINELSVAQKARFVARLGSRKLDLVPELND